MITLTGQSNRQTVRTYSFQILGRGLGVGWGIIGGLNGLLRFPFRVSDLCATRSVRLWVVECSSIARCLAQPRIIMKNIEEPWPSAGTRNLSIWSVRRSPIVTSSYVADFNLSYQLFFTWYTPTYIRFLLFYIDTNSWIQISVHTTQEWMYISN